LLFLQDATGLIQELIDQRCRPFRSGADTLYRQGALARSLGIGIGESIRKPFPSKYDHEPMLPDGPYNDLHPLDPDLIELTTQVFAGLSRDSTGAPICHPSLIIQRTEVTPTCHIAWPKVQVDAARFKDPSPDLIRKRIVAKEGEVSGSAAGDNPGTHHIDEATQGTSSKGIEIGEMRDLHFTPTVRLSRQTPQSISHEQNDL
jgi:hypothetical protein